MAMCETREWGLALCLAAAGASVAHAEAATGEGDSEPASLDTLVVLGTGSEVSIFDNPASVSTVEADDLRRNASSSVADQLRDVPGVKVFDDGTAGMKRIMIRGETSRRVTIQVDGHALTDHSPYGTPLLIDPSTIERIEVVRGPSSVLSGSNAIGGVVNIITRRGGERPLEGSLSATGYSATDGFRTTANLQGALGAVDWRLTAGFGDEDDRRTPDGRLRPSSHAQDQLSAHLGYTAGNHYWALKADQYRLEADVYNQVPEGFDAFSIRLPQRDLRKVGLFYEGDSPLPWVESLEASLYHQTIDRLFENQAAMSNGMEIGGTSDDRQTTYGLDVQADLSVADVGNTVIGVEYENDALDTDKTSDVFMPFPPPNGQRTVTSTADEARIETLSGYAQQAWELGEATTLYFGGRVYAVEAELEASADKALQDNSDERVLGSLSLVHRPSEAWSLRANLAQGYSYPTLQQLFLTTTAGGTTIVGNPDLSPETAETLELGARYRGDRVTLDATLFHTRAEDYIGEEDLGGGGPGPSQRGYVNVHEARTTGLELLAEYGLPAWDASLYLNGSVLRREFDYGSSSTTDSGTPRFAGRVGIRHDWAVTPVTQAEIDLFVRAESEAKQRDAQGELTSRAAGYGTVNAYLGLSHGARFDVGLNLNNLFDKAYQPYGEIPGKGRSASLTGTLYF